MSWHEHGSESWPWGPENRNVVLAPSLTVAPRKAGPAPGLGNTVELTLMVKAGVSHAGVRAAEKAQLLPGTAFGRACPAPCLGNTVELALEVRVWVSWP